jgi:anthranilate phosphoribosyltransferase
VGHPGIDEISVVGPTERWLVHGGEVHRDLARGPERGEHGDLPGGDGPENARIFHRLLDGSERGLLYSMVVANAGAALNLWRDQDLDDSSGVEEIHRLFATGAVTKTFDAHRRLAASLAGAST